MSINLPTLVCEYKLISEAGVQAFNTSMESLVSEGWRPKGKLKVVAIGSASRFSQMMKRSRLVKKTPK